MRRKNKEKAQKSERKKITWGLSPFLFWKPAHCYTSIHAKGLTINTFLDSKVAGIAKKWLTRWGKLKNKWGELDEPTTSVSLGRGRQNTITRAVYLSLREKGK